MPRVPQVERNVQTQGLPSVRVDPTAPIEAFGGGASGSAPFKEAENLLVSRQDRLDKVAQRDQKDYLKQAEEAKRNAQEVQVQDLDLGLAQLETQANEQARSMRGRDAVHALDAVDKTWKKGVEELGKGAYSPEVQQDFHKIAQARYGNLYKSVEGHVAQEREVYDDKQTESYLSTARASADYTNPDSIGLSMFQQENALARYARRKGLPAEWLSDQKAKAVSATHAEILKRMVVDGQDGLAQKYSKVHEKDMLDNDLAIVDRIRREEEQKRAARDDAFQNDLYMRAQHSDLTLDELDGLLAQGRIKREFHSQLRTRILNVNDDPTIPRQDKTAKLFEILGKFSELGGADADVQAGKLTAPSEGNDLTKIQDFRKLVAENAKFLTEGQEAAFYKYTQKDLDDAMAGKVSGFRNLMKWLSAAFTRSPGPTSAITGPIVEQALKTLDPSVPLEKSLQTTAQLRDRAVVAVNPNRTRYQIGQIVSNPQGMKAEVTGFDEHGDPLFKAVR